MDVNESEKIIATCRDTMLTALEKIGGQSLICSWTRHDGSTVKLSLTIRESNQNTVADCIRDMDDEEMARRLGAQCAGCFCRWWTERGRCPGLAGAAGELSSALRRWKRG
jgi:hypothetical protein